MTEAEVEIERVYSKNINNGVLGISMYPEDSRRNFTVGYMEGLLKAKQIAENCGGQDCEFAADAIDKHFEELFK